MFLAAPTTAPLLAALSALLLSPLVHAQGGLSSIPPCALPCGLAASTAAGCGVTDIPCLCSSQTFKSQLTNCAACSESEKGTVSSILGEVCSGGAPPATVTVPATVSFPHPPPPASQPLPAAPGPHTTITTIITTTTANPSANPSANPPTVIRTVTQAGSSPAATKTQTVSGAGAGTGAPPATVTLKIVSVVPESAGARPPASALTVTLDGQGRTITATATSPATPEASTQSNTGVSTVRSNGTDVSTGSTLSLSASASDLRASDASLSLPTTSVTSGASSSHSRMGWTTMAGSVVVLFAIFSATL